jgi:RNA polymerase sigma factor (sigma-70 family)
MNAMKMRLVNVVHELPERVCKKQRQICVFPYPKWAGRGRPVLAPLTKKVTGSVGDTLIRLRHESFAGTPPRPRLIIPLHPYTVDALSPTAGVRTRYNIFPFLARYGPDAKHLAPPGGQWLTRPQALAAAELSPTVRGLLRQELTSNADPDSLEHRLLRASELGGNALANVLRELTRYLRSCVKDLLPCRQDREDAAQEACMAIIANLGTYVPNTSILSWANTIVRRKAIDILRNQGGHRAVILGDHAAAVVSREPEAHRLLEADDTVRSARASVLARYSPRDRLAWRLKRQEGLEYADIIALPEMTYPIATKAVHLIDRGLKAELARGVA